MPKSGLNVALKGLDDIFSTEESRQEEQREQVQQIPVSELFPFKNHPFKVLDDDSMTRTVESISQFGVLAPLIARPRPEGGYEIISGHRRKHAAELANLDTVPVIVRNMEDDAATILMVDSGYNIVCSANTDFENDILPGADPDAVEHIKRLVKLGFYDKTELDQMAEHGYYNQGDKYLNPVISLPPNVCGCPLIVRSYHESSTFFAFVTCYYYYSNPTLVQQRMFKLLSDSLDDYFQITDYYEHVRPFHQQVIADLIENENSSEDFYRDRCLRLHLPQAGDFRLGLIYVSPSNSVRASHCALQLKAWCAVKNYGVFQYGSTVILLMVDWDSYSVRETVDADKNWQMLSDTLRDIGAYMGISLSFKHISGLSNAYHQAAEAAKQGHKSNMDETLHFYSKYYIDELLDCYEKSYPIDNLCVNQLEKLSGPDRGGSSDLELLYLYLCSERNISLTGKKMNMHRNSVIYRLQRINDSLNLDLGDPDVRFRLMLAFKVLSRKNIMNISNRDNTEPSSIVHIE